MNCKEQWEEKEQYDLKKQALGGTIIIQDWDMKKDQVVFRKRMEKQRQEEGLEYFNQYVRKTQFYREYILTCISVKIFFKY